MATTLFKDLKRLIEDNQQQATTQKALFDRLHNKPFWVWDREEHRQEHLRTNGDCCFNHIIGLPQKEGIDKPLYDYEKIIFDVLAQWSAKHIWIKKATGLGVSEYFLRFMAWLCCKDSALSGSQMCIVTGPRIELAIALIDRMKGLFRRESSPIRTTFDTNNVIAFDTKETVIELNNVKIEAFPSHHLDAMRGLQNVSFILLDEADFFPPGQQQDARDVSERYIAKSNPYIVMVSTPNAPDGLFEHIEKEPEDTCLYKRLFMDYTYGIGKIYTADEIAKAKQSPSFEREYNLAYLGKIGNVFHTANIDKAIELGNKYNPDVIDTLHFTSRSMGIDPGWGSSAFGVVVSEWADDHIQILYAEEFTKPDYAEMLSKVYGLMSKYQVDSVYIDGANPSFIRSLKLQIGEDPDYLEAIARYKADGFTEEQALRNMKIIPVNFGKYHKDMLGHCKLILEDGYIAIHHTLDKLIIALRTATEMDGSLEKESTSHNDIFDAFRLALKFYRFDEA